MGHPDRSIFFVATCRRFLSPRRPRDFFFSAPHGWLDDLQTSSSAEVTLVVDCCYSGQIADDCRITSSELSGTAGPPPSP